MTYEQLVAHTSHTFEVIVRDNTAYLWCDDCDRAILSIRSPLPKQIPGQTDIYEQIRTVSQ